MDACIIEKKILEILPKYRNAFFVHNGRSLKDGLDCLGFVLLFYKEFGIYLPGDDGEPIEKDWYKHDPERYIRNIRQLSKREIPINELRALDLPYFAISRGVITHTGVMINNREFAHMSPKSNFLISRMERHWVSRFRGAIRLIE